MEALRYWSDLLRDGLIGPGAGPGQVRFVMLGGGPHAACEAQIALALNIPVGWVEAESSDATRALHRHPRQENPLLSRIPHEAEAVRRFVAGGGE